MKSVLRHDIQKRRHRLHCGVALLSIALMQCDLSTYFFVECQGSETPCGHNSSGDPGSDLSIPQDGAKPPDQDMSNGPLGPLRKLEKRASISVDASKMKFVGMRGMMPVFWAKDGTNPPRWVVFQIDLLQTEENSRVKPGNVPTMDFPPASKISGLDFATNDLLVSSRTFVRLWDRTPSISYLDSGTEVVKDAAFVDSKKYFRDPEVDRFAVSVKPTQSGSVSAVLLRWDAVSATTAESNFPVATALVMGDLDAADPAKNRSDAILFEGPNVQRVLHQGVGGSTPYVDEGLESGIRAVLGRLGGSSPVAAGCISDLNGDGKTDLVMARGNELFVSSYVGRDTQGNGQFTDWSSLALVQVSSGQTIRAVSAVNLASDSFPELVVETESFVHFYLNKP